MKTKKGFTLIEMLVVVLIIGILAAIAVPQYQKAVEKSRFYALIPLVKAIAQAKSEYYLSTGQWARRFDLLSVTLPSDWLIYNSDGYGQEAQNDNRKIYLDSGNHSVVGRILLSDNSRVLYYIKPSESTGRNECLATPFDTKAQDFCSSLAGATFAAKYDGDKQIVYYVD